MARPRLQQSREALSQHIVTGWRQRTLVIGVVLSAICAVIATGCGGDGPSQPSSPTTTFDDDGGRSGGAMTVNDGTSKAYGAIPTTLSADQIAQQRAGDAVFEATFVPAPAPVNPGLGPRFDNVSCSGCHTGDGRGNPPMPGEQFNSMLFRVSIPGTDPHGGPAPVPYYGTQMELRAIVGLAPMAQISITYTDSTGTYADGQTYSLQVPHYNISNPYQPLPSNLLLSPRVAPQNFGLGLLEAVPEATITALATAPAAVAAGTTGHPNYVWDAVNQRVSLGRFGLKANTATLYEQGAAAFSADIGITSSLFPNEHCYNNDVPGCAAHPADIPDSLLQAVSNYLHLLGVPIRRNITSVTVEHGEQLFVQAGCNTCHVQTLETGVVAGAPAVSNQTIHPYTDLLVHDMGPGLADNRPDYLATGQEWRTPPLWGIGLTAVVNGHTNFLHDGRARSLEEAVLWHGGQATAARNAFMTMTQANRAALIAFLNSL